MSRLHKILTACVFVLILTGLGTADAMWSGKDNRYPSAVEQPSDDTGPTIDLSGGTQKQSEPDAFSVLAHRGITTEDSREQSLLSRVVPGDVQVISRTLIQGNDRLALFAYAASPNVKSYFLALKEALHASFSSQIQNLVDETRSPTDGPVFNILSFTDPAIAAERVLFVRVRERLYEFRFPPEKQEEIDQIVKDLTK